MDPVEDHRTLQTRRHFFGRTASGIGAAALASMMNPRLMSAPPISIRRNCRQGVLDAAHVAPRAKRIIYLFMAGAPSQIELFDFKPSLGDYFDKDLPDSVRRGQRLTTMTSGQQRFPIVPSTLQVSRSAARQEPGSAN